MLGTVKRKFSEANPKDSKTSLSAEGLNHCNKLFKLEQEWDELSAEERYQKRQEEMKPIMDKFLDWCREHSVLLGSKLGKVIEYSLKYKSTFRMILEDGNLVLSNNKALAFTFVQALLYFNARYPLNGFIYFFLFPNGFVYSFVVSLSIAMSCDSCSLIYFLIVLSFNPTVLT